MPQVRSIEFNGIRLVIWEIQESEEELMSKAKLSKATLKRLHETRSKFKRMEIIATRMLFPQLGITDDQVCYNDNGKPLLADGHISITHSGPWVAVALADSPVGVDIERYRDKVVHLASRFCADEEQPSEGEDDLKYFTAVWCAKEALFKMNGRNGVDFIKHLHVSPFKFDEVSSIPASISGGDKLVNCELTFFKEEDYVLVTAI